MDIDEASSDDSLDHEELEIALYGQTHFDTVPIPNLKPVQPSDSDYFKYNRVTQPFRVGVLNLPARTISSQPLDLGSFIALPKDKGSEEKGFKDRDSRETETGQETHFLPAIEVEEEKQRLYQVKGKDVTNSNRVQSDQTIANKDFFNECTAKNKTSESTNLSSHTANITSREDKGEKLLPFQITRKPKAKTKPQVIQVQDVEEEVIDLIHSPEAGQSGYESKKKPEKLSKLKDFLQLPKSTSNDTKRGECLLRQKSLTKNEEALRQRRPQVQVRRPPPPAVPVRYKQDSDTNTDYSDSDTSSVVSATKKKAEQCIGTESESVSLNVRKESDGVDKQKDTSERTRQVQNTDIDSQDSSDQEDEDDKEEEEDSDTDSSVTDIENSELLPDLDFNLAGGVATLLSDAKEETLLQKSDSKWKIDEKDRYNIPGLISRYFAPRPIQCRNCRKDGHLSRDCPEPLKQRCIFCSETNHNFKSCPQAICYNCSGPGHKTSDCMEPKMDWRSPCNRCWMTGHRERMCPDMWRQLHLSVSPDNIMLGTNSKGQAQIERKNPRVYCYNCGKKGHWGHDCRLQRMNRYVAASYPFIGRYDRKSDVRRLYLPLTAREADKELKEKKKKRKQERKRERRENHSPHEQRSTKHMRQDLEIKRQGRERLQDGYERWEEENKRQARQKRKRDHKSVRATGEKSSRGHVENARRSTSETEKESYISIIDDLDDVPSTSRKSPRHSKSMSSNSAHYFPKRRKWDQEDVYEVLDSEDSLEAMADHQVSSNEWWLGDRGELSEEEDPRQQRAGHRKRPRNSTRVDSYERQFTHHRRHDEMAHPAPLEDLEGQSSWLKTQPKTMFVYVDKPFSSENRRTIKPLHVDDHSGLSPLPKTHFSHSSRRASTKLGHHHHFHVNISPPPTSQSRKPKSPHHGGRHKQGRSLSGSTRNHSGSRHNSKNQSKTANRTDASHPASWPGGHDNKRKKRETPHHAGGFKARHDRFMFMKNDCDLKINLRK